MKTLMVKHLDVELYTEVHGDQNKPTILFLHGFPDCHKTWDKQADELKDKYCVVTFDLRGVGQSSKSNSPKAYLVETILSDIAAVINAVVGPEEKVHLVGHDWGSVLGWSFISSAQYSHRIRSYTGMSGPHLGLTTDWLTRNLFSLQPKLIFAALKQIISSWYIFAFNIPGLANFLFKLGGVRGWQKALSENGVARGDNYLKVDLDELTAMNKNSVGLYQDNLFSPPAAPLKNSIHLPVQIIIPTKDKFVNGSLFDYYAEYFTNMTTKEIPAKHWAQHSHSNIFSQWVDDFVNSAEQQHL